MWELDYKESWAPKNWCIWTVLLETTLESPLDSKKIQPVYPKGNQSWIYIGRTVAEAETPIVWPSDSKNWLIWKDPNAEKDWRQEEKEMTEDEKVGWHHRLNGHEFEWTLGAGNGQGGLACWGLWVAESDMTERLNWNETLFYWILSTTLWDKRVTPPPKPWTAACQPAVSTGGLKESDTTWRLNNNPPLLHRCKLKG